MLRLGSLSDPLQAPQSPGDIAVALAFAAVGLVELLSGSIGGPRGAVLLGVLVTTLPLAWRSVAPLTSVVVTTGGYLLAVALGMPADDPLAPLLAPLLAVYSLGAHTSGRRMAAGGLTAVAAYAIAGAITPGDAASHLVLSVAGAAVALGVGVAVRVMGFETEALEARASELQRERDAEAQAAVARERARIARELHDVIGHSVSVMGVQAGAVRRLLKPEQEREREVLQAMERIGRDAVDEVQRLLGLLRADGDDPLTEPPLTLQRVDDLVADMRRAGLHVDLRIEGDLDGVPAGRALTAFRIVQEGLTNALKHAPASRVTVTLRRTAAELEIRVVDDGQATRPVDGGGHGLVGMRERVALYGGTLEAGRRDEGGFALVARLPSAAR